MELDAYSNELGYRNAIYRYVSKFPSKGGWAGTQLRARKLLLCNKVVFVSNNFLAEARSVEWAGGAIARGPARGPFG